MADLLDALGIALVVPTLAVLISALVYRMERGGPLRLPRAVMALLALIGVGSGVLAVWAVLTRWLATGPNLPLTGALVNTFLLLGLRAITIPDVVGNRVAT